jgi:hypothetical protein
MMKALVFWLQSASCPCQWKQLDLLMALRTCKHPVEMKVNKAGNNVDQMVWSIAIRSSKIMRRKKGLTQH